MVVPVWTASLLLYVVLAVVVCIAVHLVVFRCMKPTHNRFHNSHLYNKNKDRYDRYGGRSQYYNEDYNRYAGEASARGRRVAWRIALPLAFVVGLVGTNAITYSWTSHHGATTQATIGEVTQQFGFRSGKAYPLVLGNRFAGTSGDLHVSGGLFFVSADAHFAPATAVTIGFDHNGKSYMLELPTSKITFIKSDEAKPSVKLWIKHTRENFVYYNGSSKEGTGNIDTLVERGYTPCEPSWHNLVLLCDHKMDRKTVTIGKTIESRGLSPIVQEYFDRAEITLTSTQYNKLLGG